jgi:hypothetical protein
MDAEALAQSLIPDAPNSFAQSGADRFFRRSGRTTLVSILETAKPQTAETITEVLRLPRDRLKKALARTLAEALIDPGAHDQGAGIVAMATNATNPLCYLPPEVPDRPRWSAVEWAKRRRGWLFLTSTEDSRAAALPVQNVWLDCLVRQLLTTDLAVNKKHCAVAAGERPRTLFRAHPGQIAGETRKSRHVDLSSLKRARPEFRLRLCRDRGRQLRGQRLHLEHNASGNPCFAEPTPGRPSRIVRRFAGELPRRSLPTLPAAFCDISQRGSARPCSR